MPRSNQWGLRVVFRDGVTRLIGPFPSKAAAEANRPSGAQVVSARVHRFHDDVPAGPPRTLQQKMLVRSNPGDVVPPPVLDRVGYTIVTTNGLGSNRGGVQVARDSAGRYLVVAEITDGSDDPRFGVWRFASDGALDETWAVDGLYIDPDEDGYSFAGGVQVGAGDVVYVVANNQLTKLTVAGVPDPSFGGGDGKMTLFPTGDYIHAKCLATESDGRLVVGWTDNSGDGHLTRLNSAGAEDTQCDFPQRTPESLFQTADGQYAVGLRDTSSNDVYIGLADLDGETSEEHSATDSNVEGAEVGVQIAVDSSGRYYLAGRRAAGGDQASVARYDSSFDLDTSWGASGHVYSYPAGLSYNTAAWLNIDVLAGGDVLLSGWGDSGQRWILGRLDSTGTPVPTYGTAGYVVDPVGPTPDSMPHDQLVTGTTVVYTGYSYDQDEGVALTVIGRRSTMTGAWDLSFGDPA